MCLALISEGLVGRLIRKFDQSFAHRLSLRKHYREFAGRDLSKEILKRQQMGRLSEAEPQTILDEASRFTGWIKPAQAYCPCGHYAG